MARVTVEDCLEKVESRFELVLIAAHRARMIAAGASVSIPRQNDKPTVLALREIGDGTLSAEDLREDMIHSLQKYVEIDEPEATAAPPSQREDYDHFEVEVAMSEDELLRGIESLPPPDRRDDL